MLGCDARVHGDVSHGPAQVLRAELLQVGAREDRRVGSGDAQISGDAGSGAGMVPRDHDRAHARSTGLVDRRPRLGSRGIDDPHDAEVDELMLDRFVLGRVVIVLRRRPIGDRERAHRAAGQVVHRREDLPPAFL